MSRGIVTSAGNTNRKKNETPGGAELASVWSLIAAIVACPWVSEAAFSPVGRFAFGTRLWLWLACFAALAVSAIAASVYVKRRRTVGDDPGRALISLALHATVTMLICAVVAVGFDLLLGQLRPLPASAHRDVSNAQIYGWAFAPHQPIRIVNPDNTDEIYEEKTNSRGWRDVEHAPTKTRPRILLLGDSQTYGFGVPLDQTLGGHLRDMLGDRYEVISVGVSGWGTDQQLLFLENEGWDYEPDIVVLVFTMANDVIGNMTAESMHPRAQKPRYRLEDDRLVLEPLTWEQPSLLRRLFSRSAICRRVRLWLEIRRTRPGDIHFRYARDGGDKPQVDVGNAHEDDLEKDQSALSVYLADWSDRLEAGWRLTMRLIEEINRGCREHGADLLVYPTGQPVPELTITEMERGGKTWRLNWQKPFERLHEFCQLKGIPYLVEPIEYRKRFWGRELTFEHDTHLTPEGNRAAAGLIKAWIDEHDGMTTGTAVP